MPPIAGRDAFPRPAEIKTYHIKTYDRISPLTSGFEGKGKTVFITGGTYGIGYAISRAFAEAGVAKLVILARSAKPLQEAKDSLTALYPKVQIETIQESVENFDAVEKALNNAGPIDVLVLNAFYSHENNVPSTTIPFEEVDKTFQVNAMGSYRMTMSYIKSDLKPASGEKTILAVSSAANILNIPMQVGYAASKAALTKIIGALALEHSPEKDGVRLISFHPGAIRTQTASAYFPEDAFVWEDVNLPGDFAVWLAGKESAFLNGKYVFAQWDVDDLISAKKRVESDPSFLTLTAVM